MPATYIYGAGFEGGTNINPSGQIGGSGGGTGVWVQTTRKTGAYGLAIQRDAGGWSWYNIDYSADELYMGIWVNHAGCYDLDNRDHVYIRLSNGNIVGLRWRSAHRYDIMVGASNVMSGTIIIPNTWHNVQIHAKIADASGIIEFKIDGVLDVTYTGDTQPGAADQITGYYLSGGSSFGDTVYFDDIVFSEGDWPGDIRFDGLFPDSDDSVVWEPSSGSDNYAMIDEKPASDADYVRASGTAFEDKYGLGDWDGEQKHPVLVTVWGRGLKDAPDDSKLILIADDGTEDKSGSFTMLTTYEYDFYAWANPPSGGAWTDAIIDGLLIGVESEFE